MSLPLIFAINFLCTAANISKAVDNDMKDVAFWSKCVNHALERGVKDAIEEVMAY